MADLYSAQKHSKGGDDDAIGTATSASSGAGGHRHRHGRRRRHAAERRRPPSMTMVEIPHFEVDPLWPKPLPNEWLLGMSIGVSVDDQDNIWITHRSQRDAAQQREGRRAQAAGCELLQRRAARPRLQSGRRPRPLMGRPGPRLRMAGRDARHLCRQQRVCLARRQRRQGCPHPQVQPRMASSCCSPGIRARTPAATTR